MGYRFDEVERQAIMEIDSDPPMADAVSIESIALRAHADNDTLPLDQLATTNGMRVVVLSSVPNGIEGFLLGSERDRPTAVLRAARDLKRRNLALIHELAHWLLIRDRVPHSHGDVWCLTLALAYPRSVLQRLRRSSDLTVASLHWYRELPPWMARCRMQMPYVLAVFGENDMTLS